MLDLVLQVAKLLWEPIKLAWTNRDIDREHRDEFLRLSLGTNKYLSIILQTGEELFNALMKIDAIAQELKGASMESNEITRVALHKETPNVPSSVKSSLAEFYRQHEGILEKSALQATHLWLFEDFMFGRDYAFRQLFPVHAHRLGILINAKWSYLQWLMERIGSTRLMIGETVIDIDAIVAKADEYGHWPADYRWSDASGDEQDPDPVLAYLSKKRLLELSQFVQKGQYWRDDEIRVDKIIQEWPIFDFASIRTRLQGINDVVTDIDAFVKSNVSVEQILRFIQHSRESDKYLHERLIRHRHERG